MPQEPLWTEIVNSITNIVSALTSVITAITAVVVAYIAWRKYLKEDAKTATSTILTVFQWEKQTAELRATEEGLEYYLFDTRPNRDKGNLWTIPADELEGIEIKTRPSEDYPSWGLFTIGRKRDWYYSKKLFKDDDDFKASVRKLIQTSREMAKRAEN